jgi:non-specific serine/threonine protein kinase/serine/threonine-protein kinase
MTPERWQQIKTVLASALALDADARADYLGTACSGDPELRREVDSLLESNPADGEFLDTPAVRLRPAAAPSPPMSGRRVGPYEVFEQLGRGGMGEVYRARRADGQYDQQVAVKLIRSEFEERHVLLQRFRTERQILATLDHPNIARLLDGGATDDDRPYLVMELIEGTNICDYCDAHRSSVTARLQLFRQVCSAVQYAHQRLIVHRDIKPTNIIVTADGTPKLLDFGIAKILAPSSNTELTLNRPMTLAYASPEQIRGQPVTTASDVYSLGVVLYRLLSGQSPYRVDAGRPGGLYRAIEEDEPIRPSTAVARSAAVEGDAEPTPETGSARRDGSPARLARRLSGDLDQIVLKALRKEPDRRYASVDQLSDDIGRHLNGFPVSARQGTWAYHAEKFVRRHKVGMAATALVALVTGAGVAATLVEARIAAANAKRAEQRFEQVRKLANAMVFDVHDAIEPLPGATRPRELIVRLGLEYLDQLSRDATADASLQLQVAAGYLRLGRAQGDPNESNLGDRAGAAASYRKAIGILDRLHAREPQNREVTARLTEGLSRLARVAGSSSERWTSQGRALDLRRAQAAAHPTDLPAQRSLATALFEAGLSNLEERRYAEAAAPFRQALAIFEEIDRRAPTPDAARNVALCKKRLAALSLRDGDLDAALRGYKAARAIDERRVVEEPDSKTAKADLTYDLSDLGTTLRVMSRWAEAGEAFDRAIALRREAYDADKSDARARRALASILFRQGNLWHYGLKKPRAALELLREASRLMPLDGDEHDPLHGELEYEMAVACDQLGDRREAQAHRSAALAIFTKAAKAAPLERFQQEMLDDLRNRSTLEPQE